MKRSQKKYEIPKTYQYSNVLQAQSALAIAQSALALKTPACPLIKTVQGGEIRQVQLFLEINPSSINEKDSLGDTALHWAAYKGYEQLALMLIDKEPKLLDAVNAKGNTALHEAAIKGHKQVALMLIDKKPELSGLVNGQGKTALDVAASNGHNELVEILTMAKSNIKKKVSGIEKNKDSSYSHEKIHKILSAQLQNENNVDVKVLDLSDSTNFSILEKQLQDFVSLVMKENKVLAIALHLHGDAWASLVIKGIGNDNLQLIYNDPTGSAFSKEIAVQKLISSIIEQNQNGDTIVTDLRKIQQNIESDSGAMVADNLIKIVTAPSLKKADLQKLLLGASQVNELKVKHFLIDDTDPNYSVCKLEKLLELSLMHKAVIINRVTTFEDEALMSEYIKHIVDRITDNSAPVIIPLFTKEESWSGLIIKSQEDGSLQIVYSNPTGDLLKGEKNHIKLIKAIIESNPEAHIIDIKYKQDEDKQASGAFTVNNLIKLALSNTNDFSIKDFQKILSDSETIDQLRAAHADLIHDYITPIPMIGSAHPAFEARGDESFEHKGEYFEAKEEKVKYQEVSLPPAYEEDQPIGMHILGGEGVGQLD